jgi:hypothetical protein
MHVLEFKKLKRENLEVETMEGGHAAEKRKRGVYVPDFLVQEV